MEEKLIILFLFWFYFIYFLLGFCVFFLWVGVYVYALVLSITRAAHNRGFWFLGYKERPQMVSWVIFVGQSLYLFEVRHKIL